MSANSKGDLTKIPHQILEEAAKVGLETQDKNRSGTYFHLNQETVAAKVNELFEGKLELMDVKAALKKYPWLEEYRWKIVSKDKDEYTKKVAEDYSGGYFIRILPGAEITFPLQSCLMITDRNLEQRVHNIIIAEENSNAHIITSCLQHSGVANASHLGISEIYVKKNASLNFTMIHQWSENTLVRPRSAAVIEDNATFVSNYVCMRPVRDMQMYPVAYCKGADSRVSFNTILYGQKNSLLDIGSKAVLTGRGSKAEMVSRAIAREGSKMIVRGMIEGDTTECKGHLECRGLLMDDKSFIHSIPELIAKTRGVDITHEAAVGKISEKEIVYLMTRKLSRDQAVSLIIRGFMDVGIMGLPDALNAEIKNIVDKSTEST
ncbi:MAG: SufD family Fe-S cluster assembly protein [Candidatus Bathyarchaeota archaeon]|nr:SufD family Fe-S cluster assembly protein [Candidatus Bathyarchaeota archaeon]